MVETSGADIGGMLLETLYGQLADKPTRRQTNSPTVQLADNKLANRPTRRQLNWPKKPTRRN